MKRYFSVYALAVIVPGALAAWLLVRLTDGSGGTAPEAGSSAEAAYRLLLAAAAVVAVAALGGWLARRVGQPAVVGELAAGIALGPSVLGALARGPQEWLFPDTVLPHLDTLAQFGVVFFMFLVGAELPSGSLRTSGRVGILIGHASIAVPFAMGTAMGLWLIDRYPPVHSSRTAYVLFIGLAVSITAFPVLARILAEQGLLGTRLGATGMTSAGISDVTAWVLLAAVISTVRGTSLTAAALSIVYVTLFAVLMLGVVQPLVAKAVARADAGELSRDAVCAGLVFLVLMSAFATDRMGLHAIFGPFMAGAIMPRGSRVIEDLTHRIQGVTVWFLLPLFFVTVGLRTDLGSLSGAGTWLVCLLIIAVAVLGKVASATVAAAATGEFTRRESLAIGAMMNCRGLTELIVLSVGVQLGVLNGELFSMFVFMALVTTAMTGPLLRRLLPPTPVPDTPPTAPAVPTGARRKII
ncbi:cation:proton antiporter [Streptomyces sp. NPDC058637]|uniref:cation:proton antiporter domain-containing protein n=1 Tax=Streptomyces sp. NPDC058637 TaxID=3346569 RepID=UPI0036538A33